MIGFWVVLGSTIILALVLIGLGKLFDRTRGLDPTDEWPRQDAQRGPDPRP